MNYYLINVVGTITVMAKDEKTAINDANAILSYKNSFEIHAIKSIELKENKPRPERK